MYSNLMDNDSKKATLRPQKKVPAQKSLGLMPDNLDTKEKLVDWLLIAFENPHGPEMRQLYNDLFTHFCNADIHMQGTVSRLEFDQLIENSARRIRDLGLAAESDVYYRTIQAKYDAREAMWLTMDTNRSQTITWDEYLTWAKLHIQKKLDFEKKARNVNPRE